MCKFKLLKSGLAAVLTAGVLSWASVASAVPVNGTFTLVGDISSDPTTSGVLIARGTYAFDTDNIAAPYVNGLNTFPFAVPLDSFTLTDLTGDYGSFTEVDFVSPQPIAIVDSAGASARVTSLFGTGVGPLGRTSIDLTLDAANGVQGTFISTNLDNVITRVSVSGDQYIPEPGALALMGAGFLAFGFAKTRRAPKS